MFAILKPLFDLLAPLFREFFSVLVPEVVEKISEPDKDESVPVAVVDVLRDDLNAELDRLLARTQ